MYEENFLQNVIDNGPEVIVYMMIEQIGGFIWHMNHDMAHGRIPQESHAAIDADIERSRPQQRRLVEATVRFGVEQPLNEKGASTDDYWKWYRWWSSWHKGMPDDDWKRVNPLIGPDMTQEQVAECRPSGTWK